MPYCCAMRTSPVSAAAGIASPAITRAAPARCGKPRPRRSNIVPPSFLVFSTPVAAGATAILYEAFRAGVVFCGRYLENLEKEGEANRQAGAGREGDRRLLAV